jgi:ATP adenylyltransferase
MEYVGADKPGDGECILCAIPREGHSQEKHVVERSERTYTVLNLYPYSSGHVMVVPYRHAAHLTDLDDGEALALVSASQRAIRALETAMSPQGFNLGINHGRVAGAGIVEHVHMHVVPRWDGDTNFMPVLDDVKVIPEALDRTAEKLRAAYDRD